MSLTAGTQLGPYQVISPLGAGGMGEVYRARDTRLQRDVALKVLPAHQSASPEQQQRFEREARVISQLTHPHICTLYDIGHQDGTTYLVMELLDGETLADRLAKGRLPPGQVLKVGIEIADALEAAHTHGIVHRDLKPANIMLTRAGVKLLDFGLAKPRATVVQGDLAPPSALPTEASPGQTLTERGMILGTFRYMAPEQLEGKEADARTDLFALGCVLFETATGQKAFTGRSQVSLIGSILKDDPAPISSLVPLTPPALDHLVQGCLAKAPEDRFQTAHDVKLQLQWLAKAGSQVGAPAVVVGRRKTRERLAWALAGAFLLTAVAFGVENSSLRAPTSDRLMRLEMPPPAGLVTIETPEISPDGREVAFVGTDAQGKTQIWLRGLDVMTAKPLTGTEGVMPYRRPFWSPDSRELAYFMGTRLMKISVDGGPPQKICDCPTAFGGSWSADGVVLLSSAGSFNANAIWRVPATGGVPQMLVRSSAVFGAGGTATPRRRIAWPEFLPGGRRFLFVSALGPEADNGIWMGDLDTGTVHEVTNAVSRAEFVPPGFLLFVRDTTLVAQRLDPASGVLRGKPVPLGEGFHAGVASVSGPPDFSASRNGVIVYRTGGVGGSHLEWIDRKTGRVEPGSHLGDGSGPAFSADGRWLAITRFEAGQADIWVRDLTRGASSRFTTDAQSESAPLFTPDGQHILFTRYLNAGKAEIVSKAVESGQERVIVPPGRAVDENPVAVSPDGRRLIYNVVREAQGHPGQRVGRLFVTDLPNGGAGHVYAPSPFSQYDGAISPGGRWFAYESNESGDWEIYVQSFPEPGRRWQISTAGGTDPVWAPNGHALYYVAGDQTLTQVEVTTRPSFDAGVPQRLFPIALSPLPLRNHLALSPDGTRFVVAVPARGESAGPITVILNWKAAIGQS